MGGGTRSDSAGGRLIEALTTPPPASSKSLSVVPVHRAAQSVFRSTWQIQPIRMRCMWLYWSALHRHRSSGRSPGTFSTSAHYCCQSACTMSKIACVRQCCGRCTMCDAHKALHARVRTSVDQAIC